MNNEKFYINGEWVESNSKDFIDVINPATEEVICQIKLANKEDLDNAVLAAKKALKPFSALKLDQKVDLISSIINSYKKRKEDLVEAIIKEMGAPFSLSTNAQVPSGLGHFIQAKENLKSFKFHSQINNTSILKEPIGVCGLITPWNWPLNQIACKVAPAIAAGCTMVLKPSEIAPLSALIFAEIIDESDLPKGVFNMINGTGLGVGENMSKHPNIDMISFTGSTQAGISVAKNASNSVKRVTQELGGKSANLILEDANLVDAVSKGIFHCMNNSGQSCNAPTRMLVPNNKMSQVIDIAKEVIKKIRIGNPLLKDTTMGPLVSKKQQEKVKEYIEIGIKEGANLVTGGSADPSNIEKGFYVQPTIFANVENSMTIAREEIFGPVLCIIGYNNLNDAVDIANDTIYGLSGYVSGENIDEVRKVASSLKTGMVHINYAPLDQSAPFGGYKMSGNGKEWGAYGIEDFLETKAIMSK